MSKRVFLGILSLMLLCLTPASALASSAATSPPPLDGGTHFLPPPEDWDNYEFYSTRGEKVIYSTPCQKGHRFATATQSVHAYFFDPQDLGHCGAWDCITKRCMMCGLVLSNTALFVEHDTLHASGVGGSNALRFIEYTPDGEILNFFIGPPSERGEEPVSITRCAANGQEHTNVTSSRYNHVIYLDKDVCGGWTQTRTYCTTCATVEKSSSSFTEHPVYHDGHEDHTFYGNYGE